MKLALAALGLLVSTPAFAQSLYKGDIKVIPELAPSFYVCEAPPEPCGYARYYEVGPNQSFTTLADVFTHATSQGACAVQVDLADGDYSGDVVPPVHACIVGESSEATLRGSVRVQGEVAVQLHELTIAPKTNVGLLQTHELSEVLVDGVAIIGARGNGIYQSAGRARWESLYVANTRAISADVESGRGAVVRGGADVLINVAQFDANAGGGLMVHGPAASVWGFGFWAQGNGYNPYLPTLSEKTCFFEGPEEAGALVAADGAYLGLGDVFIIDNDGFGFAATSGARVHLDDVFASGTNKLPDAVCNAVQWGGINVGIYSDAVAQISALTSTQAELAGVLIRAPVTGLGWDITGNEVGIHLGQVAAPWGMECIYDESFIYGNRTNVSQKQMPLPETQCLPDAPCDAPPSKPGKVVCPQVPFKTPVL